MKDFKFKLIDEQIIKEDNGIGYYEYCGSCEYDSNPYLTGYAEFEFSGTEEESKQFVKENHDLLAKKLSATANYDLEDMEIHVYNNKVYIWLVFTVKMEEY